MRNLFRYNEEWYPHNSLISKMRDHGAAVDWRHEAAAEEWCRRRLIMRPLDEKRLDKAGPWWRLTWPAWAVTVVLLILVVCPINWIMTGHYGLSETNRVYRLLRPWWQRLFP